MKIVPQQCIPKNRDKICSGAGWTQVKINIIFQKETWNAKRYLPLADA